MFNYNTKSMYIVKDSVGNIVAVFDTAMKANKFVKNDENYYVSEEVKYDYKNFYYKELQGTTVRVYATHVDVNVEVLENTTTTHHDMQVKDDIKNGIFDFTFCAGTFNLVLALTYIRAWFLEHRFDSIVEMSWKVSE